MKSGSESRRPECTLSDTYGKSRRGIAWVVPDSKRRFDKGDSASVP
jgi:hypothetical protein